MRHGRSDCHAVMDFPISSPESHRGEAGGVLHGRDSLKCSLRWINCCGESCFVEHRPSPFVQQFRSVTEAATLALSYVIKQDANLRGRGSLGRQNVRPDSANLECMHFIKRIHFRVGMPRAIRHV